MKNLVRCAPFLLAAAACSDKTEPTAETPKAPPAETRPKADPKKAPAPAMNEMRRFEPLTEAKAREILHAQLEGAGGDEFSRQTFLYLADLKDPAGLEAAKKLVVVEEGKYPDGAAVGLEALLAYGEPGVGPKVLELAKQYAAEDTVPDDFLLHALGRVTGPERAAAVAKLMETAKSVTNETEADPEDSTAATVAVQELARMGAAEAKELFAEIAANKELGGRERGAAVAGLLHLSDPRGQALGEKLVVEAVPPEAPEGAKPAGGKDPAAANLAEGPEASEVIAGLGVEGAVEASGMVKKALAAARADTTVAFTEGEAAAAWGRIHSASPAGPELVAWLNAWAKDDDTYGEDAERALFAVGDDSKIDAAAAQVRAVVAVWPNSTDTERAVEILDVAARRGLATKPALRSVVDSAAQISPTRPGKDGVDLNVVGLNLAAAHAFLKSGGK